MLLAKQNIRFRIFKTFAVTLFLASLSSCGMGGRNPLADQTDPRLIVHVEPNPQNPTPTPTPTPEPTATPTPTPTPEPTATPTPTPAPTATPTPTPTPTPAPTATPTPTPSPTPTPTPSPTATPTPSPTPTPTATPTPTPSPTPTSTPTPTPTPGSECYQDQFTQPAEQLSHTVDILFVTDTSGSIVAERGAIAQGIDAFVAQLPSNVDYRIGVMLAHGTPSQWSGRLFRKNTEPLVLNSTNMTLQQIRDGLAAKLTSPPTQGVTDGGEVGLFSVDYSLSPTSVSLLRSQGFYRTDAALAVVFVSDENDICAIGGGGMVWPDGRPRVPDFDNLEIPAFHTYCGSVTPQSVVDKLDVLQGDRPLLVAGIVYNNFATVPQGDENEYGYGYIDAITYSNGISVDLASSNLAAGLAQIGQLATTTLTLYTEFTLTHVNVDPNSIHVFVDGAEVPFVFNEQTNQVFLNVYAGHALSDIRVNYCLRH